MKKILLFPSIMLLVLLVTTLPAMSSDKIIIAHRGASGYLPEHTLAAKAMAHATGADYIEQDLVMTRDHRIVVLHNHMLDRVTNVADLYPDRKRDDGRYYVIDFTLDEIRQLEMTERFTITDDQAVPVYPHRFPLWKSSFRIHTFAEEIELIQGLNRSTGKNVGIYPEIKSPAFHRHAGRDISRAVLNILKQYGYSTKEDRVYLQCFDPVELQRIHADLLPELKMSLKLVQLMAETRWKITMVYKGETAVPYRYDWMFAPGAMKKIAAYADGIGPWKSMIVTGESRRDHLVVTDMVREAHEAGMVVHPYTFRLDPGRIPDYADSFEELLHIFLFKVGVDGVFTDFPDRAAEFLEKTEAEQNK